MTIEEYEDYLAGRKRKTERREATHSIIGKLPFIFLIIIAISVAF
jgi:hypothetical protein